MARRKTRRSWGRRAFLKTAAGSALGASLTGLAVGKESAAQEVGVEREVIDGITTQRIVQGEPYDLAGKRMVFTNWYYVRPGDLDWINDQGETVYVHGDEAPFAAHFVGVHAPRGIRLMAQKPEVVGPITIPHRGIMEDGGLLRGWTDNEYYESSDGYDWVKKASLTFDKEEITDGVACVFKDPSAPASERYKFVYVSEIGRERFEAFRRKRPDGFEARSLFLLGETDRVTAIRGAFSGDGLNWTALPDPLVCELADTQNIGYYDTVLRKYVIYTRFWSVGPRTDALPPDIRHCWSGVGRRAIGRTESDDFRSFPPSAMMLEPTPDMLPSEVLYTNSRTTVPRAPDHHLMFPAVWNASVTDDTRVALLSSHDGKVWHWVPGGGKLRQTQPFGQWDGGCVWSGTNLVELPDATWALPYYGHNVPHKYPRGQRGGGVGYMLWPKGRLVAVEAPEQGQFSTVAIMAPGRTLKINAVTKRTGSVRVQVERWEWSRKEEKRPYPVQLTPIPGRTFDDAVPIVGDHVWTTLTWKGGSDLGFSAGAPITLSFSLDHAQIFGLEFA
ncbi:MAG TPA: hypothetical protein HPP77_04155 [Candidatus Hydrogenedentes bacterium]|nr:hypothetical protein [Candidatus Hydrogenedentota bacterium]